jgi:small multidrug resistance family-3 protein
MLPRMEIAKSLLFFVLAGLCEIGGGYLIWQWLRGGKSGWLGLLGGVVLALYGVVATFQPAGFGRVYAAYGGLFIVMAILWGWQVDKVRPDRFDLIGGCICLAGTLVIMYWPRT